jgi:putative phosphoribosyl transferase
MQREPEIGTLAGMGEFPRPRARKFAIEAAPGVVLWGDLSLPRRGPSCGVVVLPVGLGPSRVTPGNGRTAQIFNDAGIATLRLGLLTAVEEGYLADMFDVELLAQRLLAATRWLARRPETASLAPGYFGTSGSAAIVLRAAAESRASVCAVLSRGDALDVEPERAGAGPPHVLLITARAEAEVLTLAARWFREHLGDRGSPRRRRWRVGTSPAAVLPLSSR